MKDNQPKEPVLKSRKPTAPAVAQPTRIVIVDGYVLVRDLLKMAIGQLDNPCYEIVGESDSGQGAVDVCLKTRPDLLLLDLLLPGMNGCEVVRRLRKDLPEMKVFMFSATTNFILVSEAIELGVAGYVSKVRPWQMMLNAINLVVLGGQFFDPGVTHLLRKPADALSSREREVLQLIAESHSTAEIAEKLNISKKTADKHRTNMMRILGVNDAAAVTRYAVKMGMIAVE